MSERTRHAAELGARLAANQAVFIDTAEWHTPGTAWRNPGQIAQDVDKLLRLSASLRGIHERECNGTGPKCKACAGKGEAYSPLERGMVTCSPCDGSGDDTRREKRLVQAVTDTLKPYGLTWRHQTDPRGAAVCIMFPDGAYNTMGGKEAGWKM